MSEWQAHVYCTCFQDGLTREPPFPRDALTVNRFGVVTLVDSSDHAEDPDVLHDWRASSRPESIAPPPACSHHEMKLVDTIFYWRAVGPDGTYPHVQELARADSCPLLREILHRSPQRDFPSGGIWLTVDESRVLASELKRIRGLLPDASVGGDALFLDTLHALVTASVLTANPIIVHYNGIGDDAW